MCIHTATHTHTNTVRERLSIHSTLSNWLYFLYTHTVKLHFSAREKFVQFMKIWHLNKYMQFFYLHVHVRVYISQVS